MYWWWSWSVVILYQISLFFLLQSVFWTKVLTLIILLSTPLRVVVVAKLLVLGIFPLI